MDDFPWKQIQMILGFSDDVCLTGTLWYLYKSLIINRLMRDCDRENMKNWKKKALKLLVSSN